MRTLLVEAVLLVLNSGDPWLVRQRFLPFAVWPGQVRTPVLLVLDSGDPWLVRHRFLPIAVWPGQVRTPATVTLSFSGCAVLHAAQYCHDQLTSTWHPCSQEATNFNWVSVFFGCLLIKTAYADVIDFRK